MMIKKIFLFTLMALTLLGCQNLKDSLTFKKKQGVDEFLIEKKNPLVLPPKFSELPKPLNESEKQYVNNDSIDVSKILKTRKKETNDTKVTNSSKDLEKSISNILNKK